MQVHQQTVDYCLANHFQHKKIFTDFLIVGNLSNHYYGYLSDDEKFTDVSSNFDAKTKLYIFYNEGADDYIRIMASAKLKLLIRFELRRAWAEIYEVQE
jgi:hypothetical protein